MRKTALGAALFLAGAALPLTAQSPTQRSDVRQIVTFQFVPGMTDSATAVYRRELLPAYRADTAMRRFRAYAEAESPEPLDLIVISHFDGMAGMDASNATLRTLKPGGRSVFQWYGVLSGITQRHHDQFVEMLPALCTQRPPSADASDSGSDVRSQNAGTVAASRYVGDVFRDRFRDVFRDRFRDRFASRPQNQISSPRTNSRRLPEAYHPINLPS